MSDKDMHFIPQRTRTKPKDVAPRPTKVVVAVPAGDTVHTGFAYDLAQLVGYSAKTMPLVDLFLVVQRSSILPQSRTDLVNAALWTPGATHILWLDADMRFPKSALRDLLSHDVAIVGANYPTRREPIVPTAFAADGSKHYTASDARGLTEVAALGFGLLLTRLDVFHRVEKPWFMFEYEPTSDSFFGEDLYLLTKARLAGFTPYVDNALSVHVGHLGEFEYGNADAVVYRSAAEAAPV